jgi:hypothetical protein
VQLILRLVALLGYKDHLRRTQPDWESRWDNVQELINFASEMPTDANIVSPAKTDPLGEDNLANEDGIEDKCVPCSRSMLVVRLMSGMSGLRPSAFSFKASRCRGRATTTVRTGSRRSVMLTIVDHC